MKKKASIIEIKETFNMQELIGVYYKNLIDYFKY
jgi:hypothetical protein